MSRATMVDTETVLDDLVNQFSDPMSFLRELIQNAIDAGSGEIEVRLEYAPGKSASEPGMMTVHLDDFGDGMDRAIIETKLTRLFSSGKDDDFTKIGRFGIGFVSVFAIAPQVVCVDTGRAGEYWRVIFKPDRTFDLIALTMPVEGTQIRIFKQVTRDEFEAFARRTREVILYWCKHVQVPIRLDGELLNQPFALEASCQVGHEEEGTRLLVGFTPQAQAFIGYYNRGLTLKEGHESDWPHVTVKIDSRYLEHTLTRDQVLKDRHYEKAHRLLDDTIRGPLVEALLDRVERLARGGEEQAEAYEEACALCVAWLASWGALDAKVRRRELFRSLTGEPLSAEQLARHHKKGKLYRVEEESPLSAALAQQLCIVKMPMTGAAVGALLMHCLGGSPPALNDIWAMTSPSELARVAGASALCHEAQRLFHALGGRMEEVRLVALEGGPFRSVYARQLAVIPPASFEEPHRREEERALTRPALLSARKLALGDQVEATQKLCRIARQEPEWAAVSLLKLLLLQDPEGMTPADEAVLTSAAIARRELRTKT